MPVDGVLQPVHASASLRRVSRARRRARPHARSSAAACSSSLTASITDPLVNFATDFIDAAGYAGVFVLMTLESACIPIPSEAIMLFAGFNVADGDTDPVRDRRRRRARQPGRLLDRLRGRLLRPHRAARAEPAHPHQPPSTSNGPTTGSSATATRPSSSPGCCRSSAPSSRCRPASRGCRSGASPCSPLAGCIPWVLVLALIGREVGDNWEEWQDHLHYLDYAVARGDRRADRLPADPAPARPSGPETEADGRRRGRRASSPRHDRAVERDRPRRRPGTDRAAAGLQLGPPLARPLARRLGLGRRSTPSCARASRSRSTPARRRRC